MDATTDALSSTNSAPSQFDEGEETVALAVSKSTSIAEGSGGYEPDISRQASAVSEETDPVVRSGNAVKVNQQQHPEETAAESSSTPLAGNSQPQPAGSHPFNHVDQEDEFINTGLHLWEESRRSWLQHHADISNTAATTTTTYEKTQAKTLNVDDIIDVIFTSSREIREQGGPRNFPVPVPLPQMVDILQDLWEAEGLDA